MKDERKANGLVRLLLERGAKISIRDRQGLNALHYCCINQLTSLIDLFLCSLDININSKCRQTGNTVLHFTAITGNEQIAEKLIKHTRRYSLSVDVENWFGFTPLQLASSLHHSKIVSLLADAGASLNRSQYQRPRSVASSIQPLLARLQPRSRTSESVIGRSRDTLQTNRYSNSVVENIPKGVTDKMNRMTVRERRSTLRLEQMTLNKSWRETLPLMWKKYAQQYSASYRKAATPLLEDTETSSIADSEEKDSVMGELNVTIGSPTNMSKRRHSSIPITGSKQTTRSTNNPSFNKAMTSRLDTNRRKSMAV
ncbi:hypothetical protein EB796_002955 [Bugula neritina]|uniref:Uncharacterized protein n=1 Tax=Bugula neritina TaxID=10212 RepID=A0A7J7KJ44_BUGNE|nr:hypothetical protein EB796_002955 [Bugula neritina]